MTSSSPPGLCALPRVSIFGAAVNAPPPSAMSVSRRLSRVIVVGAVCLWVALATSGCGTSVELPSRWQVTRRENHSDTSDAMCAAGAWCAATQCCYLDETCNVRCDGPIVSYLASAGVPDSLRGSGKVSMVSCMIADNGPHVRLRVGERGEFDFDLRSGVAEEIDSNLALACSDSQQSVSFDSTEVRFVERLSGMREYLSPLRGERFLGIHCSPSAPVCVFSGNGLYFGGRRPAYIDAPLAHAGTRIVLPEGTNTVSEWQYVEAPVQDVVQVMISWDVTTVKAADGALFCSGACEPTDWQLHDEFWDEKRPWQRTEAKWVYGSPGGHCAMSRDGDVTCAGVPGRAWADLADVLRQRQRGSVTWGTYPCVLPSGGSRPWCLREESLGSPKAPG